MRIHALLCMFLLGSTLPSVPRAGETAVLGGPASEERIAEADRLLEHGRFAPALDLLEELAVVHPEDAAVRWRLGKAFIDLGEATPDDDVERKRELFARAVLELREAVRLAPDDRDAVFNLAIAVGRDGLVRGAGDKVRASREVKELAERTIEIDPTFDGAYHLLGRWHREVKSLGFFTRTLVKVVYGGFPEASYEDALRYFRMAQERRPRMAHLLEIGICHELLGQREQAEEIYRQVLRMDSDHVDAWLMRAEAQRRLDS